MTQLRLVGSRDQHAAFHSAQAEVSRRVRRREAANRQKREGAAAGGSRPGVPVAAPVVSGSEREALLVLAAAIPAGLGLYGLVLYAPPSLPLNVLKVALVLVLASAGVFALLRALVSEEA